MRKEGTMSTCVVCGGLYYVPPSHRALQSCCSRECRSVRMSQLMRRDLGERFWEKVDKSGDCWIWTASVLKTGYGCIRIDKRTIRAHRIAYELANGPVPDGLLLRHTCDNRRCVNPAHLVPGTHKENAQDALDRGRHLVGEDDPKAKLSNRDVAAIRTALASGITGRSLARRYAVDESMISQIKNRKARRHG